MKTPVLSLLEKENIRTSRQKLWQKSQRSVSANFAAVEASAALQPAALFLCIYLGKSSTLLPQHVEALMVQGQGSPRPRRQRLLYTVNILRFELKSVTQTSNVHRRQKLARAKQATPTPQSNSLKLLGSTKLAFLAH